MLSRQLLLRQQLTRLTCVIKNSRYSSELAVDPDLTGTAELRLSAHKPKRPTREPFAKSLCCGNFDVELLAFPEPQTHDRHREFFEWLKPIEDYINERVDHREIDRTRKIPDEVFEELKKLGVLRAAVDDIYGGLGLNDSEYAKLVETVSAVPVLGTYLLKRDTVVKFISNFGSEDQKSNILPKIATGEIIPTFCFSESPTGSMAEPLESKVTLNNNGTRYILNGRKTYVIDATNANLFVVMAQHVSSNVYVKQQTLSAFLVPGNIEGIVISEPLPMLGQQGLDICSVTFNDVEFPNENKLATETPEAELFNFAMGNGKHHIGAQAIGIMKRFLNMLTKNVIQSKNFNIRRESHDSLHETIGGVASALYSMEAMTYITTGLMDSFEKQDCILEKALVEVYCTNTCTQMILRGMQLVGGAAYCKNENFELIIRDALAMAVYDRTAVDTKTFAALLGVQYAGVATGHTVKKERNPLQNPVEMFLRMCEFDKARKLYIEDNLHPSLRVAALSLEKSVDNLQRCVHDILTRYGASLLSHKMDLTRLADVIVEIYAMIAVVARASRSYCIGLRNAEIEVKVAMIYTNATYEKINSLIKELTEGDWSNGDIMLKEIANSTLDKKSYFASHPLERTY